MKRNLTLHILNSLPYSSLNRDDTGTPKRATIGGVTRGMLSSQSIKRAARTDFELASLGAGLSGQGTARSAKLAAEIVRRAKNHNPELDEKVSTDAAMEIMKSITNAAEGKSNVSAWMSFEELEVAAVAIANGLTAAQAKKKAKPKTKKDEVTETDAEGQPAFTPITPGATGSLSIAAFGRMFAASPANDVAAGIAVSPAICTHETRIETDYFSTAGDDVTSDHNGADYIGVQAYTSGVFYRSVTIDRAQLRKSWSHSNEEEARELLSLMVRALVYKLPSGKSNNTAPYVAPLAVIAEEQHYRLAYDFETPLQPDHEGGFKSVAIKSIGDQRAAVKGFDGSNFGKSYVAGTESGLEKTADEVVDLDALVSRVVDWVME